MASEPDRRRGTVIAGINVTPLVDISLVLLIIFLVTAKIIVSPAVPLDLPPAAETDEVQVILSVIVPAEGPVLVNGEQADDDQRFATLVATVQNEHPGLRAVIHADGRAPHARVLRVLDRLRGIGVSRVAFGAKPLEEGAP